MRSMIAAIALAAALGLLSGAALGQSYPAKPVRLIVGFPAGGPAGNPTIRRTGLAG